MSRGFSIDDQARGLHHFMMGLRSAALAEAVTLMALVCVAMPIKYLFGEPRVVSILGPLHGLMFIGFLWFIMRSWAEGLIDGVGALRLFVGALLPMGGFVNERWLRSRMAEASRRQ